MSARRAAFAAGLSAADPVRLRQVHGARVVRSKHAGDGEEADGAFWLEGDGSRVPVVRTADCVPALLAERDGRAAAAVHAGWRGVVAGVVGNAIRELTGAGVDPARLVVALGPAIGPCCYEVGEEVARAVEDASGIREVTTGAGRPRLDLRLAVRRQLEDRGVPPETITTAPWCTRCRDDLFFSYRRDGEEAGRMLAVVGPRGRP